MKPVLFLLGAALSLAVCAADDRAALNARLEKVNARLSVFEKSKDHIFVERHLHEVHRLRKEKQALLGKLAKIRDAAEREEFDRKSEALRENLERQWATNAVIDVSHVPGVPGLPSSVEAVQLLEQTPIWTQGCGKTYAENGVVVVDGGERQSLWIVRKDYDAEGRLTKVTPICRYAMPRE